MTKWKTCYEQYKEEIIWKYIEKVIKELEGNQDIKVTTHIDYVVGYLVKKLSQTFIFSRKQKENRPVEK